MITQPNPHVEARPAAPDVQHGPHIHLPRRSHLRPAPLETQATGTQPPNIALAGLQIIVGYEWLLAGGDKLLLGGVPGQMGKLVLSITGWRPLPRFFAPPFLDLWLPQPLRIAYH